MIETVLSIETSCDDTSVAVVQKNGRVLAMQSASQDQFHQPFGGIVPEIACRNHSIALLPLIEKVVDASKVGWKGVQGVVVTNRPGLVGSLIVGLVTAKSIAQAKGIPLLGVNHLEGHLLAPFLSDETYLPKKIFGERFIALAVSGGHTSIYDVQGLGKYRILGSTLDDAAGEAFDKFGKMIGLGWPGGVKIDKLAAQGNIKAYEFPRSMILEENEIMSFSGLKSSAQRLVEQLGETEVQKNLADLCASYQEAIVDVLMAKLERAVRRMKTDLVVITGGVSANSRLRARAEDWAARSRKTLMIPPLRYCTDNAAMIGYAGILHMNQGARHDLALGPSPASLPGDFEVDAHG